MLTPPHQMPSASAVWTVRSWWPARSVGGAVVCLRIHVLIRYWFLVSGGKPAKSVRLLNTHGMGQKFETTSRKTNTGLTLTGSETQLLQINDDFCDCADGSDEPGTGACMTGSMRDQQCGFFGCMAASAHIHILFWAIFAFQFGRLFAFF